MSRQTSYSVDNILAKLLKSRQQANQTVRPDKENKNVCIVENHSRAFNLSKLKHWTANSIYEMYLQ